MVSQFYRLNSVCLIAFAFLFWTDCADAGPIYSDSEFNNSDWDHSGVFLNPGRTAVVTVGQVASGGNPGAYMEAEQDYVNTVNNVTIRWAHEFVGQAAYDSSVSGAIHSIDVQFDFNTLNFNSSNSNSAVTIAFMLTQDGKRFRTAEQDVRKFEGWKQILYSNLAASDFEELNPDTSTGTALPDFSIAGGEIRIGFWTGNFSKFNGNTTQWGIDNFEATINNEAVIVPEPSTFILFGMGIVGLSGYHWRRKRT